MSADYNCILDGHGQWMAISSSKIHVFVEPNGQEPLFRYEFDRNPIGNIPGAHIQFHGQHPELEQAMRDCGDSTPPVMPSSSGSSTARNRTAAGVARR